MTMRQKITEFEKEIVMALAAACASASYRKPGYLSAVLDVLNRLSEGDVAGAKLRLKDLEDERQQ